MKWFINFKYINCKQREQP